MARDLQNSFVHLPPWLEGGGYLIEFPDLPGCMSDGETPEEAIANGRDALKCAVLTLREFGGEVALKSRPAPSPSG